MKIVMGWCTKRGIFHEEKPRKTMKLVAYYCFLCVFVVMTMLWIAGVI